MEPDLAYGPENAIHRGLPARDLSVTELCDLYGVVAQDGLQVDRALPATRTGGTRGALATTAYESPNRTARESSQALLEARRRHPSLGRQEAADAGAEAPSELGPACTAPRCATS